MVDKSINYSNDLCLDEDDVGISSSAPGRIRWSLINKFNQTEPEAEVQDDNAGANPEFSRGFTKALEQNQVPDVPVGEEKILKWDQESKKEGRSKYKNTQSLRSQKTIKYFDAKQKDNQLGEALQKKMSIKNQALSVGHGLDEYQMTLLGDKVHFGKDNTKKRRVFWGNGALKGLLGFVIENQLRFNLFLKYCPTIHPEGRLKLLWNIFFCICILYQFFTITIELFFDSNWDKINQTVQEASNFTSNSLKYFILIDVFLNMTTGFYYQGDIVLDKRRILKNYCKRLLIVDTLVLVPLFLDFEEEVSTHSSALYNSKISIIKLLFIFRLVKLNRTFYYIDQILSINEKIEGILALIKLCSKILFTAHLFACTWYFVGDYSRRIGSNSWMNGFQDFQSCDWRTYYLVSFYWSITTMITVGYGDITPRNNIEVGFVITAEIIGCGLFAYSLSKIGSIFEKIFAEEDELKSKLRVINRYMKRKDINFQLQGKVRRYLNFIMKEASHESSQKEIELINKLSVSLKRELLLQANGKILTNSPILKNNFSLKTIEKLTETMVPVDLAPDELVYQRGDIDTDNLYFVSQGKIDQYINIQGLKEISYLKLKTFKEGDVFGGFSFFTGRPREMSTVSVGYTKLYVINKADFLTSLMEEQFDYEIFCQIRDSLLVYQDLTNLFSPCPCCRKIDHNIMRCPILKYCPEKRVIIEKYIHRKKSKRIIFQRKISHSTNALKNVANLSRAKEKIEEDYDLKEYDEQMQKLRMQLSKDIQTEYNSQKEKEYKLMKSAEVAQKEEKNSSFFISEAQKSLRSEIHDMDEEEESEASISKDITNRQPISYDLKDSPTKNSKKDNFIKFPTSITPNEKSIFAPKNTNTPSILNHEKRRASLKNALPSLYKPEKDSEPPSATKENLASLVSHTKLESVREPAIFNLFDMSFDDGKNFFKYFPHNNRTNVIRGLRAKGNEKTNFNMLRRTNNKPTKRMTLANINFSPRRANSKSTKNSAK